MYGQQRECEHDKFQDSDRKDTSAFGVFTWAVSLAKKGGLQLAEVHRLIWSIHLSDPSGKRHSCRLFSHQYQSRICGRVNPTRTLMEGVCWQTAGSWVARIRRGQNLLRVFIVASAWNIANANCQYMPKPFNSSLYQSRSMITTVI